MTILEYFFKSFDICRKKLGLSQKQVAEFVGINENDMSRYRNGKRGMDDDLKAKVADFFGYELLDFLTLGRSGVPPATGDDTSGKPRPGEPGDWPQIKAEYDTIKALLAGQIQATQEQTSALGEIIADAIKSVRDEERDKMLAERENRIKQLEKDIEELKEDRDRLRTKVEGNILALVRSHGVGGKNAA